MKRSHEPEIGKIEFLPGKTTRLFRHRGMLCLETETAVHLKITPARAFPLSRPEGPIGFLTFDGKDIGLIRDAGELDPASQSLLLESLEKRYFAPKIQAIHAIVREHGHLVWRVRTDRGEREFFVHDFRENLLSLSGGNLYINDLDGNRYDIGRISDLDGRSQAILQRWV